MTIFDHNFVEFPELTNAQLELFQLTSPHVQIVEDFDATVVKVVDGDTVRLRTAFRDFDFPLRLLDIDAPELGQGGREAKVWLTDRLLGQKIKVLINPSNRVGKFGRLLGHIMSKGLSVAEEMLFLGLVKPFGLLKEGEPEPAGKIFRLSQWLS